MLFAAINVARKLKVDPELALRASSRALPRAAWRPRRSSRAAHGAKWDELDTDAQVAYYARARLSLRLARVSWPRRL